MDQESVIEINWIDYCLFSDNSAVVSLQHDSLCEELLIDIRSLVDDEGWAATRWSESFRRKICYN